MLRNPIGKRRSLLKRPKSILDAFRFANSVFVLSRNRTLLEIIPSLARTFGRGIAWQKIGHKTCCLYERAAGLGLVADGEDLRVISLMATTDAIIRSRYIEVGFFSWPKNLGSLNAHLRKLAGVKSDMPLKRAAW